MPTPQQEDTERKNLRSALETLAAIDTASLVRKEELGTELNFSSGVPYFERALKLFADLRNSPVEILPYSVAQSLASQANAALEKFKNIKEFSIKKYPNNAEASRDNFINAVRDGYDEWYRAITPVLAYTARTQTNLDKLVSDANKTLEDVRKYAEEVKTLLEQASAESNQIIGSMRQAAAEAGVSQHAIYFKLEAETHEKEATKWLKRVFGLAVATGALALLTVIYYAFFAENMTSTQSVQLAVAKVLLFLVLFYSLTLATKNYRAHKHNHVLNKHRQNALSTFQAFVKAAEGDEQTKSAVLLRAAETIFSPSVTGYISQESESQGYPQVLEVVRSALGQK